MKQKTELKIIAGLTIGGLMTVANLAGYTNQKNDLVSRVAEGDKIVFKQEENNGNSPAYNLGRKIGKYITFQDTFGSDIANKMYQEGKFDNDIAKYKEDKKR